MVASVVLSVVLLASGEPPLLSFKELFEGSPRELRPSQKLLALNGKRVKMVGYMAQVESAPLGAFYLAARPVVCDEAGAGSGDLPPDAVRVIVRSAPGKKIEFIPRPLEVTGILQVGNRVEEDGQLSGIRLMLDQAKDKRIRSKAKHTKAEPNKKTSAIASKQGSSP